MDDIPILASSTSADVFNQVLAMHGGPAYLRRAQHMEQAWNMLVERCRQRRLEELAMVRTYLAVLKALAGSWTALRPLLADDAQVELLERLDAELRPALRQAVQPVAPGRKLRRALGELHASIVRFNQRWPIMLAAVDLTEVNELRDGYNRFYVLEKECAVRSPRVARQGFQPMAPALTADLAALLPVLPVPQIR